MGRPSDGGSTWSHHSDAFELIGPDDVVWGRISVPVSRQELTFSLPLTGDPWTSFHVLRIEAAVSGTMWHYYHPLLTTPLVTRWTPQTPREQLVPFQEFRARAHVWDQYVADAPVVATVDAAPGAVRILDASGRERALFRLGDLDDPTWPEGVRGSLRASLPAATRGPSVDRTSVRFCLPTGPQLRVESRATSLP